MRGCVELSEGAEIPFGEILHAPGGVQPSAHDQLRLQASRTGNSGLCYMQSRGMSKSTRSCLRKISGTCPATPTQHFPQSVTITCRYGPGVLSSWEASCWLRIRAQRGSSHDCLQAEARGQQGHRREPHQMCREQQQDAVAESGQGQSGARLSAGGYFLHGHLHRQSTGKGKHSLFLLSLPSHDDFMGGNG